jgi:dTDP-4-dehydrorhamnose 3,5-epimerase
MKPQATDGIRVFEGGIAVDDRGTVSFVNDFDFRSVKRFYKIENFSKDVIRAFHGHLKEAKYVYVVQGSIILAAVTMTDTVNPSKDVKISRFVLSARKPTIVFIPPGYFNGFRILEENSQILFFSTSTLDESKGDDYRIPADYWGPQVWSVENR